MNEDDIAMEIDESEEISLSPCASRTSINDSPASPMPQGKSQLKNASDSDGDSKIELEEGEIDSDVSSSPDHSRRKDSDRNLLKQRTHKKYSSNSDISDGSSDEDRPASKRGSAHGSESERGNNARVVKVKNAAERESRMSDDDDDDVKMISGSDEDVSEDEKASQNVKEDRRSDDEVGDGKDETSESSSEESAEENESKTEKKTKKQKEVQDESDIESSAGEDSDSVNSEESDEEIGKEKKDATSSESESESDAEGIAKPSEDKSKSLSFKKSNQKGEKETSSKLASGSHKHSDHDSDNDVIDHLEIAAPQQALLRATKKKSSKEKSRDRSGGKDGRESSKNRDKKDNLRYKEKDRRDNKSKEYYDKKSLKYKERRYDAYEHKTDKDSGKRSKSSVEKKSKTLVEEDLRKKLLQKRSTRDDVSGRVKKDQRDYKDKNRRDEKNNQEKGEKRRDEKISKSRKEEKEKSSEVSVTKSSKNPKENDNSKDVKGIRSSKEKSPKGSNSDKSKKRRREKTKTEVKKKKNHSGEESSDDDEKDAKKPATKRPRSAEVETEGKADVSGDKNEEEKDHNKEYSYDDISPVSSEELSPPPSPVELKKPTYYPAIMGCRDVIKEFQWLNKIEEGTYGVVYRARDNRTDEIVALKRLKMEKEKEGFPITSLREINTLLKAQHPNIVTVREIVVGSNMDKIYIVMDYVEHDLKALMETMTQPFLVGEVKTLMMQLLRGVQHLHDNWILHRDIKASNLLLSHKGILKIGDFGLAREYGSPLKQYTSIVVTLWYRAPELLLGGKMYATAVDIWSVGCVFAELLTMKPLFPGKSEIDQINRIFKELGTPNDKIWPGPPSYSEYPLVKKTNFANHPYNILRQKFGATLTDKGFNLLNRLLTYDPDKRITADAALEHEFFGESPLPVDPSMFPTWPAKSELGHRAVRKHNASPKAPEGGAAASKVANEDSHLGFHMPAATKGYSAKGAGFNLKF